MAQHYLDDIAAGLAELHGELSSQGFVNFVEEKDVFGNPWNWDDFFTSMAWQGLKGEESNPTQAYQSEVIDKNLQDRYDFYTTESQSEGGSNKCK